MAKNDNIFDIISEINHSAVLHKSLRFDFITQMSRTQELLGSPWTDMASQLSRLTGELYKSPMADFTTQINRNQELLRSPWTDMASQLSRLTGELYKSPMADFITQMNHTQELLKSPWAELASQFTHLSEQLSANYSMSSFTAKLAAAGIAGGFEAELIEAVVVAADFVEHDDTSSDAESSNQNQKSLLNATVAEVKRLMTPDTATSPEELNQQAIAAWISLLSQLTKNALTTASRPEFMATVAILSLMLTAIQTIFTVRGYELAKQSSENSTPGASESTAALKQFTETQADEFRKTREELESLFAKAEQARKNSIYYRVERRTSLLSERTNGSKVMDLRPGKFVMRLQRHYDWVEVECYDYSSGQVKRGWVMKKYLRLTPDE